MLPRLSRRQPTVLHICSLDSHAPSSDLLHGGQSHFKHGCIHTGNYGDQYCICVWLSDICGPHALSSQLSAYYGGVASFPFPFFPLKLISLTGTHTKNPLIQHSTAIMYISNKRLYSFTIKLGPLSCKALVSCRHSPSHYPLHPSVLLVPSSPAHQG